MALVSPLAVSGGVAAAGTTPGHAPQSTTHLRATRRRTNVGICRETVITTLRTELSTACRQPPGIPGSHPRRPSRRISRLPWWTENSQPGRP
ncbi:hypothetical protein CLJ1_0128 [Pseudomonas paraeruginosa]|nr:hypothetical protein CLJ1_0128 [Pseudomonas aeruginosa]